MSIVSAEDQKFLAEAKAAEAAAEKHLAEAVKSRAEATLATADARKKTAEASVSELMALREQRKEQAELAKDVNNNVYYFNGAFSNASANACISQLTEWMRTKPGADIEIVFNSPGGSVIDGMALFDFIQMLKARGHHVTTSTIGYAASMGGILLQAGTTRVMGREAYILIHEIAFGAGGKIGEVEDEVEFGKKIQKRIISILASRSNLSEAAIKNRWRRKDWWLDSEDALKFGFVDEVR